MRERQPQRDEVQQLLALLCEWLHERLEQDGTPPRTVERGHEIMFGPFGHVNTAVDTMIKDGIDGVLILTDDDENLKEIAARFTRETGRPVWRNLTEIPR